MTAESAALVVATVFLGIIALGQLYFLRSAVLTFKRIRRSVEDLEARIVPLIEDMHTVTVDAHHELVKIDETISRSHDLTMKLESAAGIAKVAAATPLIKAASVAAGIKGTVEALEADGARQKAKGRRSR